MLMSGTHTDIYAQMTVIISRITSSVYYPSQTSAVIYRTYGGIDSLTTKNERVIDLMVSYSITAVVQRQMLSHYGMKLIHKQNL